MDDGFEYLVCLALGIIIGGSLGNLIGDYAGTKAMEKKAVIHKVGVYVIINDSGDTEFKWKDEK
jgi:hypothetical protein